MKYALNLADDGHILSVTFAKYATANAVVVEDLPDGDVSEYRYVGGKIIHDPIVEENSKDSPTQLDRIEAQVAYTAMMTDTLLEV